MSYWVKEYGIKGLFIMYLYEVRKKYGHIKRWSMKSINELACDLGIDKGAHDYWVDKEAHYNRELGKNVPTGRWLFLCRNNTGTYVTKSFNNLEETAKYLISNYAKQ